MTRSAHYRVLVPFEFGHQQLNGDTAVTHIWVLLPLSLLQLLII